MKKHHHDSVVRCWGFYTGNRLVFAGVASRSGPGELRLRFTETEYHAHTATLPQRIGLEQLVRDRVQSDIQQAMGFDWKIFIHFEPYKINEHSLARNVFATLRPHSTSNS